MNDNETILRQKLEEYEDGRATKDEFILSILSLISPAPVAETVTHSETAAA